MTLTITPEWWVKYAACRGLSPEIFFLDPGQSSIKAVKVCKRCAVVRECDEYAERAKIHFGVWGGLTENQRDIRRRIEKNDGRRDIPDETGDDPWTTPR